LQKDPILSTTLNPSSSIILKQNSSPTKEKEIAATNLDEFHDIPGINQKGTVDQTTYVNNLVVNHDPMFVNIDSYAERCVACVFRKLKNNLIDLQKLFRLVSNKEKYVPGTCIIVGRAKDSRITVTRSSQDGTKSTKKIHPHLAMIQIFSNPQVQNVNHLQPISDCKSPFLTGALLPEMCINPFHYQAISSTPGKSPSKKGAVRTKAVDLKENFLPKLASSLPKESAQIEFESDSDCLSDSSSDSQDLQEMWSQLSFSKQIAKPIEIQCDDSKLMDQLTVVNLKRKWDRSEPTVTQSQAKSPLYLRNLDLSDVSQSTRLKPRAKSTQTPKKQVKLKDMTSDKILVNGYSETKNSIEQVPDSLNVPLYNGTEPRDNEMQEYTEEKKKEDELIIKDLLEDIKGSFEADFDMGHMDLDRFGAQDFPGFSISNTFSMPVFNEPTEDGMPDLVIDDITTVDNVHQLTLIQDPNIPSFSIEEGQDQVNPMIVEAWTDDT